MNQFQSDFRTADRFLIQLTKHGGDGFSEVIFASYLKLIAAVMNLHAQTGFNQLKMFVKLAAEAGKRLCMKRR
jgi:uncharacterized protein involved in high-affinity Fe2+ transport